MAKIVGHTILTPGHAYPFVAVLEELQRVGHEVTLCASTPATSGPETLGTVPLKRVPGECFERFPTQAARRARDQVWLRNLGRTGGAMADAMQHILRDESPDLVVVDPMLWGSMVAAEASGLPWVSLAHNPLAIRGQSLDVRGPGLRPARGLWGRIRDGIVDLSLRASMETALEFMNSLRATHGLLPLSDFRARFLTAPLVLAATAEPFEYHRNDWPDSIVFVGPLIWNLEGSESAVPHRSDERPLVLVTGSSVPEHRSPRPWLPPVLSGLAKEPVRVVATLGAEEIPPSIPENCLVTSFLPHHLLIPHASCVVCHGGHGTATRALAAGVPVVAIPFALDRFEVARRVEVSNAGVMLPERRLTPRRLRDAVRQAITQRKGAERIADAFRRAGGAARAGQAIEGLLTSAHLQRK